MLVVLGADHAGFVLKQDLVASLIGLGHRVLDLGTDSTDPVDYPDIANAVASLVVEGRAERGVLVCGTGVGMAIAANKIPGIRAALCTDPAVARLSREHNDANVLALGARTMTGDAALAIVRVWLESTFLGGRHARRVDKLTALERASAGREPVHAASG